VRVAMIVFESLSVAVTVTSDDMESVIDRVLGRDRDPVPSAEGLSESDPNEIDAVPVPADRDCVPSSDGVRVSIGDTDEDRVASDSEAEMVKLRVGDGPESVPVGVASLLRLDDRVRVAVLGCVGVATAVRVTDVVSVTDIDADSVVAVRDAVAERVSGSETLTETDPVGVGGGDRDGVRVSVAVGGGVRVIETVDVRELDADGSPLMDTLCDLDSELSETVINTVPLPPVTVSDSEPDSVASTVSDTVAVLASPDDVAVTESVPVADVDVVGASVRLGAGDIVSDAVLSNDADSVGDEEPVLETVTVGGDRDRERLSDTAADAVADAEKTVCDSDVVSVSACDVDAENVLVFPPNDSV
jgi:hypothetical protein